MKVEFNQEILPNLELGDTESNKVTVSRMFVISLANEWKSIPDRIEARFGKSHKPVIRCTVIRGKYKRKYWTYVDEWTVNFILILLRGKLDGNEVINFKEEEHPVEDYEGDFEMDMLMQNISSGKIPEFDEFTGKDRVERIVLTTTYMHGRIIRYTPLKTDELIMFLRDNGLEFPVSHYK